MNALLNESVQYLKGVGPSRVKQLEKLGINTVYDLLTHFPREYEDRNNIKKIKDFMFGEYVVFVARVATRPEIRRKGRGFSLTYFYVADDTARIRVTIFNQPYLNDKLEIALKNKLKLSFLSSFFVLNISKIFIELNG